MINRYNILDEEIGRKVRFYRKKTKLGLKTLAEKLNISLQQLHKYELGINKISASILYEIAKNLNVSVNYFFQDFSENTTETSLKKIFSIGFVTGNINDETIFRERVIKSSIKINLIIYNEGLAILDKLRELNQTSLGKALLPDIIIIDSKSFSNYGNELLKTLKKDRFFSYIPIIMLIYNENIEDIMNCYNLQASNVFLKSSNVEFFKQQIDQLLTYWHKCVRLPFYKSNENV